MTDIIPSQTGTIPRPIKGRRAGFIRPKRRDAVAYRVRVNWHEIGATLAVSGLVVAFIVAALQIAVGR